MDPIQTMPNLEAMVTREFTAKEWLLYYKNVWTRNAIARSVDVAGDTALKAKDPTTMVNADNGQAPLTIGARLEYRKILVQDAIDLVAAIDSLLAIPDVEFADKVLSKEALKVADDMLPPEQNAGDACQTQDGKAGTLESDGKGGLVCVATVAPAGDQKPGPEADTGAGI